LITPNEHFISKIKKGEFYILLEINKIYNMDCIGKNGMRLIPDRSIDMILCDLPYGTTACKWDTIIPFKPLWEQYERIIKDDGSIVLFGSQPFTSSLVMSNIDLFKYELIWDKKTGLGFLDCRFRPLKSHENILIFSKGGCSNGSKIPMKYNPQGLIPATKKNSNSKSNILNSEPKQRKKLDTKFTNYPKSIYTYSRETGLHPCQKSVPLLELLIKTYTNTNDLVLDNCIGSGTTAIACINTNRNYIGFELDKTYFDLANKRIENHLSNTQNKSN
jgi:site-specific DNA-methyltransferase (adenine-specific)